MKRRLVKQILFLGLMLLPLVGQAAQGLLFQVSRAGQVHYLLGTMHSDDPRVIALLDEVTPRLEEVDQVVLEILPDMTAMVAVSMAMMLPPQQRLSELVGDALFRRAAQAAAQRGLPAIALERLRPWAAAITLGTPEVEGLAMDQALYQRALTRGKKLAALETPEEQMAMFESLSSSLQKRLLEEVLDQLPRLPEQLERMIQAYLAGDLERLRALSLELDAGGDPELAAWFQRRLIDERNRRMFERMQSLMEKAATLVAVGALHLPGKGGLLQRLRGAGYEVKKVF